MERPERHNPTRTIIPSKFVDLGKLLDEDTRSDYLRQPDPVKRSKGFISIEDEPASEDEFEDFIVHADGTITWLRDKAIAQ